MTGTIQSVTFDGTNTHITLLTDFEEILDEDLEEIQYALLKPLRTVMPSRKINGLKTTLQGAVQLSPDATFNLIPPGIVFEYGSDVGPPSGFLWCDGEGYNNIDFPNLESVIGTTFGTAGAGTFRVPDLRGRSVLGLNNMGGVASTRVTALSFGGANANTIGGTGGEEVHIVSVQEMPSHQHGGAGFVLYPPSGPADSAGSAIANITANIDYFPVTLEGGSLPHNTMSPWQSCYFMIKT